MNIPRIKIILSFFGESIDFEKLDNYTMLQSAIHHPAEIVQPGDGLLKGERYWKSTTGYVDSWYVDDLTNKFLEPLKLYMDLLSEYIKTNEIETKLNIVTEMTKEVKPSIYFDKAVLHLLSKINADIDIDQYITE